MKLEHFSCIYLYGTLFRECLVFREIVAFRLSIKCEVYGMHAVFQTNSSLRFLKVLFNPIHIYMRSAWDTDAIVLLRRCYNTTFFMLIGIKLPAKNLLKWWYRQQTLSTSIELTERWNKKIHKMPKNMLLHASLYLMKLFHFCCKA